MISLHIKALKQLNKLAPSQSPAWELALNSKALPEGAGWPVMKALEPQAEVHRMSFISQVKKWIPAVSNPNCAPALHSHWLFPAKPALGHGSWVIRSQLPGGWLPIHEFPEPLANSVFYPAPLQVGF